MSEHEEHPAGEATILIPPVWLLIFGVATYFTGRALPGVIPVPYVQEALAVLLALGGIGMAIAALVQFGRKKTTYHPEIPGKASALVTDGVYTITRNPMYVGMALVLLAIAVWFGSLLAALIVPMFMGVITMVQIVPEERALARIFGAEFEAFKRRTPRWLFL